MERMEKMEKKSNLASVLAVVLALMLLLQGYTLLRVIQLRNDVWMVGANDDLHYALQGFQWEVQTMLEQQASMLDQYGIEEGSLNAEDRTVPISIWLTLKEYTEETTVSLDIGGQRVEMARDGARFNATVSVGVFAQQTEGIVTARTGDVLRTETLSGWYPYDLERYFPSVYSRVFFRELDSNRAAVKGTYYVDAYGGDSGDIKNVRLLAITDGKQTVLGEAEEISALGGLDFHETLPSDNWTEFTVWLEWHDQYGFIHRTCVYSWEDAGLEGCRVIFDKDGTMLHCYEGLSAEQLPKFS